VDSDPDVRPLDDESAQGRDLTGVDGVAGEGGPLADVFFGYDAADLSDEARAALGRHAQWLQANPGVQVTIEGHCDERGTVDYNLALGEQRARAVHDYLVSLGVAAQRLSSVSLGKERPLDTGHGEAAWARNRRAHFVVRR
jgi:peptidoglycan-associated lipoprotein